MEGAIGGPDKKMPGFGTRHSRERCFYATQKRNDKKGYAGQSLAAWQARITGSVARERREKLPNAQPASLRDSSASELLAINPWLSAMRTTWAVLLTSSLCLMLD
jgi:hypothetical protein